MTDRALKTYLTEKVGQGFQQAGVGPKEAKDLAKKLVQECEQAMSHARWPQVNLQGDRFLTEAAAGDAEAAAFLGARRGEGVRDEDIRWYWNMTELERRVIDKFAEHTRMALYLEHVNRGQTFEQAAQQIRKVQAIYGDPADDGGATGGNDRRLFPELQDRVDRFIELHTPPNDDLRREIERSSSFNGWVRTAIRAGRL